MDRLDRILFIPAARKGNGTGHLKRCAEWSSQLPVQNFYIPDGENSLSDEAIERITSCCGNKKILRKKPGSDWDLVILDNRYTIPSLLAGELEGIPYIGIDEGGPLRKKAPYLLDILPGLWPKNQASNRDGFAFLELPQRGSGNPETAESGYKRILVSFGGEDPSGLTRKILSGLNSRGTRGRTWVLVEGPSFTDRILSDELNEDTILLQSPPHLKDELGAYDLVLCSYGLTVFEALAAGTDVLTINPTAYHDRLSNHASIPCIKQGWKQSEHELERKIESILNKTDLPQENSQIRERYNFPREEFSHWIGQLTPERNVCPVCGMKDNPVLYRYAKKSYFQCLSSYCGMVYMVNFLEKKDLYGSAYFFEDYQKQYGKTYAQDFENIKQTGFKRLDGIDKYKRNPESLLDIGCAFGPFLEAAKERNYDCYGIDISDAAVEYIRTNLTGIRAAVSSFEKFDPEKEFGRSQFDVVTLWYVIEHFKNPAVLFERVNRFLREGGILAFSTPNGRGVSRGMNPVDFFRKSPDDHFTIWDRRSARKVLKRHGFIRIRFVITGYHPERIPIKLPFRNFMDKSLLLWFCKLFKLGDTFEIYAMKKGWQ